jgi:hypothetical protein
VKVGVTVGKVTVVEDALDRWPEASAVHEGDDRVEWNGWAFSVTDTPATLDE